MERQDTYYPTLDPETGRSETNAIDFDQQTLDDAVAYATAHESRIPDDFAGHTDEFGDLLGPMPETRGAPNGLVLKDGRVATEWGETDRADLTFSVTKSFLSCAAGLAFDRGLIEDVHDPVRDYVDADWFESDHNAPITWHHLLQQTSEWRGTLFDKPDRADRREGKNRDLRRPGSFWEYNDVRVNLLGASLLHVWGKPLPAVIEEEMMVPIGASDSWQWHGYENSDLEVDGRTLTSVPGGGHWGGGLWINSRDLARWGHLFLRRGEWDVDRIFSREWVDRATAPSVVKPSYGYLWWLNTERELWPDLPAESFAALGHGSNIVWIDPTTDVVAVVRWFGTRQEKFRYQNELFRRIRAAFTGSGPSETPGDRRPVEGIDEEP